MRPLRSLCLLFATSAPALAGTWYVDVHGLPPGDGTPSQPYTSIQYAIQQPTTVHGDTLLVAPGDYVENLHTLSKRVLLRASDGPLATAIRPNQAGFAVRMQDGANIEGFTITSDTASTGIRVEGECVIRRCIVRDFAGTGILSPVDAFVYECTVTGNAIGIHAQQFGGFAYIQSCIVSLNDKDVLEDPGSAGTIVSYCLIGIEDPGFWSYVERDLNLRPGSPAIDGGNPAQLDPDGSVIDIGALTYDPAYVPPPTTYCSGKQNAQGCTPAIGAIGSASATSTDPFLITALDEIPNQSGLLFFGFAPGAHPFQGGLHCVEPPLWRVGLQNSGGSGACTGSFSFDMQGYIQSGAHPGLVAGAMVYCQWWNRDPQDLAGFGTGLSDALSFGIAP